MEPLSISKEHTSVVPIIGTFTSLNLHICIPKGKELITKKIYIMLFNHIMLK